MVSALDLTVKKMAMEIKNFSMEKDEFEDLQCDNCEYLLNPGDKIYSCTFSRNPDCEIEGDYPRYLCEKCYKDDRDPELRECTYVGNTTLYYRFDPMLTKLFAGSNRFQCNFSGNGCEEEFPALKAHENACIYQEVECPTMNCKEVVIFKNVDDHLDQDHEMEKVNNEWNFKGTQEELAEVICCLSKYDRQFYPQFSVKNDKGIDHLYFKIIMNGPKESAISFKIYLTFFLENGFQFSVEDQVYPITENDKEEDCSNVMLKKVIEYYDAKTLEYKKQDEIKFTLKVVNEKLDEIAKDKENSEESGNL